MFFWTHRTGSWQPAEKASTNGRKILLKISKGNEKFVTFWTKVSSNCSCGHVEGHFDVHAKSFMRNYELFSIIVWKDWRKCILLEFFSSKGSTGHVEPALSTLQKYIWTKGHVFLAQLPNMITITTSMKKFSINASLTCRIKFWQIAEIFSRKRPKFFRSVSEFFEKSFSTYINKIWKIRFYWISKTRKVLKFFSWNATFHLSNGHR